MPDILLDANHDIDTTGALSVDGAAAVAQNLLIVFRTVRGEIFTDAERGLPIYEIMGRGLDDEAIAQVLRSEALLVREVVSVDDVTLARDTVTRRLSGTMDITTIYGPTSVEI